MDSRKILQNGFLALIPLLGLASLLLVGINLPFKFSEFKPQVVVTLPKELSSEIFEKIAIEQNVAKVDRENMAIAFQNVSSSKVSETVQNYLPDRSEVSVVTLSDGRSNFLYDLLISIALIFVGTMAAVFYFHFKNNPKLDYAKIYKIYAYYAAIALICNVIAFGVLSLISNVYILKQIDLWSVLILNFVLGILFFSIASRYKLQDFENIGKLAAELSDFARANRVYIMVIYTILAIVLSYSLGSSYIMFAVLTFAALLIIYAVLIWMQRFLNKDFDIKSLQKKLVRKPKKVQSVASSTPSGDSKNEKKQKSKKKKNRQTKR